MSRCLRILLGILVLGVATSQAAFPVYTERAGKYPSFSGWDGRLPNIWAGWKSRFVVDGKVGGNTPGSKTISYISEGQSYGLMLSLWMGDQATFNTIWSTTESKFWVAGSNWYAWNITNYDANFAGDADIDICGALIFASALVDSGIWAPYTVGGNTYKAKAIIVLKSVIANFIDKNSNYRINSWPGAGDGIRNPSYHMPGWYPIFKEFAAANGVTGMDWDLAANGAFDLIEAQPNAKKGLARNFSTGSGAPASGGTSSPNRDDMGFDAVRVPFRMALAAMWYPTKFPRAVAWGKNVWAAGVVDPAKPGLYTIATATLDGWVIPGYEKFMTRAMWGSIAAAVKDSTPEAKTAFSRILQDFSTSVTGNNYLVGEDHDTTVVAASLRNYFAQSLGLLGALAISGRAWNVWDDLKHPWVPPDTSVKITTALKANPVSVELVPAGGTAGASNVTTITATLNRATPWTLKLVGRTTQAEFDTSATSSSITYTWNSLRRLRMSKAFASETVDVRLVFNGIDSVSNTSSKATVTVTPTTSILTRPERGVGMAGWTENGLRLQDNFWQNGERVRVAIRDLEGRSMSSSIASFRQDQTGLVLELPRTRSMSVRILEVTDLSSLATRQYLISPNP